jgi:hypothetical protein
MFSNSSVCRLTCTVRCDTPGAETPMAQSELRGPANTKQGCDHYNAILEGVC